NQKNQKQKCQTQLQKIFIGLQIYANEHANSFPVQTNATTSEVALAGLVPRYTADSTIFVCPGSKDKPLPPGTPLTAGRISYAYYMGRKQTDERLPLLSDRQVDTKPKVSHALVFSEDGSKPANNHHKYGGVFLFSDGSAEHFPAQTPIALPVGAGVTLLTPQPRSPMKVICDCGAKYAFDATPEMWRQPLVFTCPTCGVDLSARMNELVRQKFAVSASTAPSASAAPATEIAPPPPGAQTVSSTPPPAAPQLRIHSSSPSVVAPPPGAPPEPPPPPPQIPLPSAAPAVRLNRGTGSHASAATEETSSG